MPASRLKRRRALSYGVVTRQFRRLTLRVAGEFSRLTSAQCLCLPRPSHHRLGTQPSSTWLASTRLTLRRGTTATLARAHTLPSSLHAHSFISAFLLVLFLGDVEHDLRARPPGCGYASCIDGRATTPTVWFNRSVDWYVQLHQAAFVTRESSLFLFPTIISFFSENTLALHHCQ